MGNEYSQNYDIYNETNQTINQTVETEVTAIQDCSASLVGGNVIDLDGCTITGDINQSSENSIVLSCTANQSASVTASQTSYQEAVSYSSQEVQQFKCSASAYGGGAQALGGLFMAGAAGGKIDCALPQSISVNQTNITNQTTNMVTTTSIDFEQYCSQEFSTGNTFSCTNSTIYGNVNQDAYLEGSISCTAQQDATVSSYQNATQYAETTATQEDVTQYGSFNGMILLVLLIIIILIAIGASAGSSDDSKKKREQGTPVEAYAMWSAIQSDSDFVSAYNKGGASPTNPATPATANPVVGGKYSRVRAGETGAVVSVGKAPAEPFPAISVAFLGAAVIILFWFFISFEFGVFPFSEHDPGESPAEFEAYEAMKEEFFLASIILISVGAVLLIAECVMMTQKEYGSDWATLLGYKIKLDQQKRVRQGK